MSEIMTCVNPIAFRELGDDPGFKLFVSPDERTEYINQVKPFALDFELTSTCAGSCAYCYASSVSSSEPELPKEKVHEVINDAIELGVKQIGWGGGDPIARSDWFEIVGYAIEKGLRCTITTSGLISKDVAKKICALGTNLRRVAVHIDSLNPEIYSKLHTEPKTLDFKIQGYRNLLEAGYPPDQVIGIITFTKFAAQTIEETVDWYVDEMGSKAVCFVRLLDEGFARLHRDWEPSLSEIRRAIEYRAAKLGKHWLRIGASDGSFLVCRTLIGIMYDGRVSPCTTMRDLAVGNLYQESLKEIFSRHRDAILFNYDIKGYCGKECENRDICFGCRASAYHYLGDVRASDPKCPMNTEAKEYYFK